MTRRFDPRVLTGSAALVAGAGTIALALFAASPVGASAAVAAASPVYLTIELSDSAGGQLPPGAQVTVFATVSNPSSFTTTGTDVSSMVTTHTTSNDAAPTITLSLSTSAVSFASGGGSYTCGTLSGQPGSVTCSGTSTSSALHPGNADVVPVILTVVGAPGEHANVTGTVSGNQFEVNHAPASSTVATDTATVANPGSYTNEAPSACFTSKVGNSDAVVENAPIPALAAANGPAPRLAGSPQVVVFHDGNVTITVTIPSGALPNGTRLSIYAGNPGCWNPLLAQHSQTFVDGYAAGWAFNGTTSFDASGPLTLSVSDSRASSGDPLYKTNPSGVASTQTVAGSQTWVVTFTDDPGFVLAQAAAVASSSSSASSTTTVTAPPAGGGPTVRQASPVPLALGVLAIVGGTALIGTRRRRRAE